MALLEKLDADLKKAIREGYGTTVGFAGRGEMIPNNLSYCELDPDGAVDEWGIPVLRFHFEWSDHEWKKARHMEKTCADISVTFRATPRMPACAAMMDATAVP